MEVSGRTETAGNADDQDDIYCQPCYGEGDEVQAEGYCENCYEYFCSSCIRFHRKMSATKYHVIKTKKDMSRDVVKQDPCVKPCHVHKTEIVKYYCSRHDLVGCGDCMVFGHKTCKVELVRDVSSNYGNSDEINMIRQELEATLKQISSIKQEMADNFSNAEDMKDKVKNEIHKFRKQLNTYLDQAEEELLNEVDRRHSKDINTQTHLAQQCNSIETEIKQFQHEMHQYEENINQLFVTAKLTMDRFKTYQETIKQISSNEIARVYKFVPSKEMQAPIVSKSQIGKIYVVTNKCVSKKSISIENMTAHFVRKLNVQTENERICRISGMAMISSDEILLADYSNKSLKVLNVRDNRIVSKYIPQAAPWDVTVINTETCAATLPGKRKILFMNKKCNLSESHTWDVKELCRSIDYHSGKVAVSYWLPPAIDVFNMEGEVLHNTDLHIFFPSYLAFKSDGTSIFISDLVQNALHEQIVAGKLKMSVYENLKNPQGHAVKRDGTIVQCNKDDSDKLTLLSSNTGEVKFLNIQHIKNPTDVIIDEETSTLYVYEFNENSIKSFALY